MPAYAALDQSAPPSPSTSTRRSSFTSLRRPSISSFRFGSRQAAALPDPDEMDAAFDGPDEEETSGLLNQNRTAERRERVPGEYDFDRDYTLPPDSPPPFQPYSAENPAPGNNNGIIPTAPPVRPSPPRHFLGGILPLAILPRQHPSGQRLVGGGTTGVFTNLSARPDRDTADEAQSGRTGPEYVPELEQKDAPPSYQSALRDAVPPYWDTTVVLPSSNSPFGPLSSSMSGDEILIDGMAAGNLFGFAWNLIVSFSFQFVGFLLTYVLHTTHGAKYGSRVGLGVTLIQFGLNLRSKAAALLETGQFPSDPSDPIPTHSATPAEDEAAAESALKAFWGPGSIWPATIKDPYSPEGSQPVVLHNVHEAEAFALQHNTTLTDMLGLPSAEDVGRANEWFSFALMSLGWFLVLTSLGGWWRVKRFEKGLRQAQRESEAAQAAAQANREGEVDAETPNRPTSPAPQADWRSMEYYTTSLSQTFSGIRNIQRGFLGMHGPRMGQRGGGHAPLPQDENDHELLEAQGFGLESMAGSGEGRRSGRGRGLWGVE